MDQVRKDFEEWLVSVGYSTEKLSKSRNGNTYLWATLHADWQTWQAAHAKYAKYAKSETKLHDKLDRK